MIDESVQSIKRNFASLLEKNEYITHKMYLRFLNDNKRFIDLSISDSDVQYILSNGESIIDEHNEKFISNKLEVYKDYFDNMFSLVDENIKLDDEQRRAIVTDDDYSLIIAGAGAGKTTTMAAKVKYLIEKKHVNPSKIAVISYTNKATQELEDRIKYGFNLQTEIMTFHSLGNKFIKKLFKRPLKPVFDNEQKDIIVSYVKDVLFNDKELLQSYVEVFNKYNVGIARMFSKGFVENYLKFNSFDDYFKDYKRRKQEENKFNLEYIIEKKRDDYLKIHRSLKYEAMRSVAEVNIANFLFFNGIDYSYEKPYPEKVNMETVYLPDFTIEVNGVELYIEYYGLSQYMTNGTLSEEMRKKYNDIRDKKRQFHKINNNNYIELDYERVVDGRSVSYMHDLRKQLLEHGVRFKQLSNEEVYNQILDNFVSAEFSNFVSFMINLINDIKSSVNREKLRDIIKDYIYELNVSKDVKNDMIRESNLFMYVYNYYEKKLIPEGKIDFSDMIYYANKYIRELGEFKNLLDYDYLIIDEYQDISIDRYMFTRNISLVSNAKVVSVGDDWQTIFSFAGSRIDLFLRYNELFPGARQLFINSTYRSGQELVSRAGAFVMKNPLQIKKSLLANKTRENPIKFCFYIDNQIDMLRGILKKIHEENPKDDVLILARRNKSILSLLETDYFKEGIDTRIIYEKYPDMVINAMSVHRAKGLGADQVIVMDVTNKDFPCVVEEKIWLNDLFKPRIYDERFLYAEDRRIFYVALTRTKKDVYLLVPSNERERSPFIYELID